MPKAVISTIQITAMPITKPTVVRPVLVFALHISAACPAGEIHGLWGVAELAECRVPNKFMPTFPRWALSKSDAVKLAGWLRARAKGWLVAMVVSPGSAVFIASDFQRMKHQPERAKGIHENLLCSLCDD